MVVAKNSRRGQICSSSQNIVSMPSTSEYSPNAQNLGASALTLLVHSYPQADANSWIHDVGKILVAGSGPAA